MNDGVMGLPPSLPLRETTHKHKLGHLARRRQAWHDGHNMLAADCVALGVFSHYIMHRCNKLLKTFKERSLSCVLLVLELIVNAAKCKVRFIYINIYTRFIHVHIPFAVWASHRNTHVRIISPPRTV